MANPTIITLSSIPPRFKLLTPTFRSLLDQDLRAEAVRLYIPWRYRRFPDWDGVLPDVPDGVRICRCDEDLGPATKVLPACLDHAGQNVDILFCDDDRIYDRQWHARLKHARRAHPNACIVDNGENLPDIADSERPVNRLPRVRRWRKKPLSYRIKRVMSLFTIKAGTYVSSGYVDVLAGHGGGLVKPEWFGVEAWDIPSVLWTVDDPWLSGHLERRGVPIWLVAKVGPRTLCSGAGPVNALHDLVEMGHDRVKADLAAIDYMRRTYGIWKAGGLPTPPATWMSETMRQISLRALNSVEGGA